MGGSGSGYNKGSRLTQEELRKRHRASDGDGYLFDVEYQKLKEEQERIQREYERERAEYLRITERLRQEMLGGSANMSDRQRFMAALSDMGVQLQRQQQEMQTQIDRTLASRLDVDRQMDDLRQRAFSGSTSSYRAADRDYKGFEAKASNRVDYSKARVVEMTPEEYLRRVAFDAKGGGFRDLLNQANPSLVDKYARQMLRGTRFNAPSLNYSRRSANGAEKALAAIMNGYTRIPVLIIE